eukprot:c529_g1_i1.p1 GENE.c529_g1_i1~~c529_g1_i1.p1  ORF type:complete len:690 (-),score=164.42 c529_g1_i1:398-2260(-)
MKAKFAAATYHHGKKKPATLLDVEALLNKHPDHPDHYEVLGLGHLRRDATLEEITKAHRQLSLVYHPDKARHTVQKKIRQLDDDTSHEVIAKMETEEMQKTEAKFRRIQSALEVLTDPRKRQSFDSEEELTDAKVPSEKRLTTEGVNFFTELRPIFSRFAYFSATKPVPDFGDAETPIRDVQRFYEFWNNFQSWRDFSHEDEYNPDEAEFREEKRWMERENDKVRKKKKAAEREKIRKLVELSQRLDPRIIGHKQATLKAKEEALAIKQAKQEENRKRQAEERRKTEEEKKKREEEEQARLKEEKILRDREKNRQQKIRSRFRKACAAHPSVGAHDEVLVHIEHILVIATIDDLESLMNGLEDHSNAQAEEAFRVILARATSKQKAGEVPVVMQKQKLKPVQQPTAVEESVVTSAPEKLIATWTDEELARLTKAVLKFPVGTQERWAKISSYVETRSADEVMEMVKTLKNSKQPLKTDKFKASQKAGGKDIASPLSQRLDEPEATPQVPQPPQAEEKKAPKEEKMPKEEQKEPQPQTQPQAEPQAQKEDQKPQLEGPPMNGWTKQQHQQMEVSMKKYSQQTPDRWDLVAAAVEGKNKAEVMEHFKELVLYYKKVKDAQKN